MTSGFLAILFMSIGRMPFLAQTLDIAYLLFALVIKPGFYLHHVEVADQDALTQLVAVYYQTTN